jgi:PAS domain S-box-containing protein
MARVSTPGVEMVESSHSQEKAAPALGIAGSLMQKGWVADIFDAFIDSIDVGVYILDCNGIIKQVNRFIVEQYGWEPHELLERNIFELMPDLGEVGIEEKFRQVIHQQRVTELTNLERKDHRGQDVVYNLKGIPIIEGEDVVGVMAVMNDITEKRILESQVAEAEEYLQSLIDNANDIIYTLDRKGHITFLNKMGQEITGYEFNPEVESLPYSSYIVEKDLAKNREHFSEALKGKPQRYATSIIASDGKLVNILINLTPIHRDNDVVGVLGIARDITERNQMQAQLLQAGKMAAIGELAAGVAHEINNPVGIISAAAEQLQFLLDRKPQQTGETIAKISGHVEMIREHADRCKRITQGLLNFARKTEMRNTEVDLEKLVGETVALLENRALTEHKKIVAQIPSVLPLMIGDPHLLEQVFLNLANNALDAIESGGIVTIRGREEGREIAVDIVDNGSGIEEENLEKIFDPFFTTKPIGKGTGLGLSICFGIVERMGGSISIQSEPGVGTTFTVRLPVESERKSDI